MCAVFSTMGQTDETRPDSALTVEATPSSDIAGLIVGEGGASSRNTSRHDGVREGNGGLQLDQCNVITAEETRV